MSLKNKEISLEDEIRAAIHGSNPVDDEPDDIDDIDDVPEVKQEPKAAKEPKKAEVSETPELKVETEVKVEETPEPPPVALSGAIKAKWNELPEDVRAEWKKREDDIHRMMTAKDGDLNLGRTIKEIATPYQAIIAAEGGTVESAFKDLMNTAYVLRTGSPQQKAQVLLHAAQQFNVDLRPYMGGQQYNPMVQMQEQFHSLRQQVDPAKIKSELQEEMERDRLKNEIEAFAANPENVHFEAVKPAMAALLTSGRAQNLQEAYEMAIWSDPSIRSNLLKAQQEQEAAKRKAEMAAKKKASASVTGSPGTASPSAKAPQKSLEDELRENLRAARGEAL